jgi:hypothetical protein
MGPMIRRELRAHHTPTFSLCNGTWCNLINFVAVKGDPNETPVSCAIHLNDFRGLTVVVPEYPEPLLQLAHFSLIATTCHKLNQWPITFSQAYIHMTLWELVRLDIYDKIFEYTFCKFFSLHKFRQ